MCIFIYVYSLDAVFTQLIRHIILQINYLSHSDTFVNNLAYHPPRECTCLRWLPRLVPRLPVNGGYVQANTDFWTHLFYDNIPWGNIIDTVCLSAHQRYTNLSEAKSWSRWRHQTMFVSCHWCPPRPLTCEGRILRGPRALWIDT